jgi:sugar lactone lactonase YvrE
MKLKKTQFHHMLIKLAFKSNLLLGESPVWNSFDNLLYFIDIKNPSIHRLHFSSGCFQSISAPSEIGCIAFAKDGSLIAAMQDGLAHVDFERSKYSYFSAIDTDLPNNRPNDGKCDKAGRLWIASMDNKEVNPSGRLWCISHLTTPILWDSNFVIGNGIDWSPDAKKMYFTDSVNRSIFVYDYDLSTGSIKNKKIFAQIPKTHGFPDGLTVDSEGYIWSAHWDGWQITRYAPDGTIDLVIKVPAPRPTSLIFGGPHLNTLYITSARYGLTAEDLKVAPHSGSIFAYESSVQGQPCNLYFNQ